MYCLGHRFRPAYDFDYVALDLLSVYPEVRIVFYLHITYPFIFCLPNLPMIVIFLDSKIEVNRPF